MASTKGNRPSPAQLLELAHKAKQGPRLIALAPAAEVLRRKGLSWEAIREWFAERGIELNTISLNTALKRWGKTPEYLEFCLREDKESELDKI